VTQIATPLVFNILVKLPETKGPDETAVDILIEVPGVGNEPETDADVIPFVAVGPFRPIVLVG
jgi:hypothetical protein